MDKQRSSGSLAIWLPWKSTARSTSEKRQRQLKTETRSHKEWGWKYTWEPRRVNRWRWNRWNKKNNLLPAHCSNIVSSEASRQYVHLLVSSTSWQTTPCTVREEVGRSDSGMLKRLVDLMLCWTIGKMVMNTVHQRLLCIGLSCLRPVQTLIHHNIKSSMWWMISGQYMFLYSTENSLKNYRKTKLATSGLGVK